MSGERADSRDGHMGATWHMKVHILAPGFCLTEMLVWTLLGISSSRTSLFSLIDHIHQGPR